VPPSTTPSGNFFCTRGEYVTMSNGIFNFNFLALLLSQILGGPKFTLGGSTPPGRPLADKFFTKSEYFTMSNCVFNFNILALVLFGILGGSQIYIRGPCAPRRPPIVKILKRAQVLAYIYIIVNFQLRSSIHAGLMECALYNRFALKNLPKWGFWGILVGGVKIFGGNPPPRNAMTADLRRLVIKLWRCSKYPSLYTRQRNYNKKKH